MRRERGNYRYADSSALHAISGCPRVDRFIVAKAVEFFWRCATASIGKISSLVAAGIAGTFPELADVWRRHRGGELKADGILLYFHDAYDGSGRTVYGTGQWCWQFPLRCLSWRCQFQISFSFNYKWLVLSFISFVSSMAVLPFIIFAITSLF